MLNSEHNGTRKMKLENGIICEHNRMLAEVEFGYNIEEVLRAKNVCNVLIRPPDFASNFASTSQCACKIFSMCLLKFSQILRRAKWVAPFLLANCLQNDVLRAYKMLAKQPFFCSEGSHSVALY